MLQIDGGTYRFIIARTPKISSDQSPASVDWLYGKHYVNRPLLRQLNRTTKSHPEGLPLARVASMP